MKFLVKGIEDFIDLHNCYIQLKIRVKNTDDTNLAENEEIGCINYPISALLNTSTSTSTLILLHTRQLQLPLQRLSGIIVDVQ